MIPSGAIRKGVGQTSPTLPAPPAVQSQLVQHDPVAWIENEFYIPERHGPILLEEYARRVLREAYRRDENGDFAYSIIVWSDLKKSAKSSIAAAVCLERALHQEHGRVKIIANDIKQAESRVYYYAKRAVQLNPVLSTDVRIRQYKMTCKNYAEIEAIPIDPTGEAGGNDDFICYSELWGALGRKATIMWTEMTLSPTKFGRSQRWVETYAGFSGESLLLEQLYDMGVTNGRLLDVGVPGLELYVNEAARQLTLWNTQPRCPWQTPRYYAQEEAVLTPEEFKRVHRNQWSSSSNPFVPIEWWDASKAAALPPLDKYKEVVVAIDAAISDDCFCIMVNSRTKDKVIVRECKIWIPPKGGKIVYSNVENPDDPEYPEGYLRQLAQRYNVIAFTYDQYQLHELCTRLSDGGVGYFLVFPQGAQRAEADKQLYDLIKARRIVHDGQADLRLHVQNANRVPESADKLRIVKRSESLKIDGCVALSMCSFQALKLLPE